MSSSRLIVKGLPSNCTESKLRAEFTKFGVLTDCTLKYTKEGKFRRFAFIGFEKEENARSAKNHFNNTFMNSSKLKVEECKPFGDETKPRAWSRYAKDSSSYKRLHPENSKHLNDMYDIQPAKKQKTQEDSRFSEFLQLNNKNEASDKALSEEYPDEFTDLDDLESELFDGISGDTKLSLILRGIPPTVKAKNVKDWLIPVKLKGMKLVRNSFESAAFISFYQAQDVAKVLKRNGQFIGGNKVQITTVSMKSGMKTCSNEDNYVYEDRKTENASITEAILETGRLFVRNLPFVCREDELQYLFKNFGEVADLQMIINKKTGLCKGFAIVTFVFPENALAAFSSLDGTIFKGRMLHILPGEEKNPVSTNFSGEIDSKSSFKKIKLLEMKANAGKSHSWNTLFLGANAVADTFAAKLNVDKSDILNDVGETSAGVRLALAETRLVRDTREFLLSNGVCLDAFSRPCAKRSDITILVKNLSFGIDISEIKRMFERYGPVKNALMPPEGICAIIEMQNAVDARKAFSGLAYRRLRSQPLYLEWAPFDVFSRDLKESCEDTVTSDAVSTENISNISKKRDLSKDEKKILRKSKKYRQAEAAQVEEYKDFVHDLKVKDEEVEENGSKADNEMETDDEQDQLELNANTTVFVKNLNFDTTEESLRQKFASRFKVRSVTISKKRDLNKMSKPLSMGFGFVQFYRAEDAKAAVKDMQSTLLDGHCLELKLSHRENIVEKARSRKSVSLLEQGECTKILVRNIPFQASRKEMMQLFGSFGELRAFRMPKKISTSKESHRGFGFVDYLTCADARRAFNALVHSTHFYGRRLVLEWAKTTETLEELREKTIAAFRTNKAEVRKQKQRIKSIEKDLTVIDDD